MEEGVREDFLEEGHLSSDLKGEFLKSEVSFPSEWGGVGGIPTQPGPLEQTVKLSISVGELKAMGSHGKVSRWEGTQFVKVLLRTLQERPSKRGGRWRNEMADCCIKRSLRSSPGERGWYRPGTVPETRNCQE